MDLEITKSDGSVCRLSDFGIVYDVIVNGIRKERHLDTLPGVPGLIDYGSDYGSRTITVPFKFKPFKYSDGNYDLHDYAHLRDKIYDILTDTEPLYIREMRRMLRQQYEFVDFGNEPKSKPQRENEFVNGRRFKVVMTSELSPEQFYNGGEVTLEFETFELPFQETIYTTLELHDSMYTSDVNTYGLVDGIEDEYVKYRFTSNRFTVYNAGNVEVNPYKTGLTIEVKKLRTYGGFTILNETTGDRFVFKENFYGDLKLEDATVTGGAFNLLGKTNYGSICLAPGKNVFKISGGTFDRVDFDFNFYYK